MGRPVIDIVGNKYERLVVLERADNDRQNQPAWKCLCDCGNTPVVSGKSLKSGATKSCGCYRKEMQVIHRLKDITGKRYGHLVIVKCLGKHRNNAQYLWLAQCDCGNTRILTREALEYDPENANCGCITAVRKRIFYDSVIKNELGNVYGELSVIKQLEARGGEIYWQCMCSCGNTTEVRGSHLRKGAVRSCGCKATEFRNKKIVTHGMTGTRWYANYNNRKRRLKSKELDKNWNFQKERFLRTLFQQCVICGITEKEHLEKYKTSLHVDHVLPLKTGHGLEVGNATILCAECNRFKHAKKLEDLPAPMRERILLTSDLFALLWSGTQNEFCTL
jgi:hypothetical protein